MIDVQPYLDKLDRLKEYMDAYVELKVWMYTPLKVIPYEQYDVIQNYNIQEYIDSWNNKYKKLPEYLQLNN